MKYAAVPSGNGRFSGSDGDAGVGSAGKQFGVFHLFVCEIWKLFQFFQFPTRIPPFPEAATKMSLPSRVFYPPTPVRPPTRCLLVAMCFSFLPACAHFRRDVTVPEHSFSETRLFLLFPVRLSPPKSDFLYGYLLNRVFVLPDFQGGEGGTVRRVRVCTRRRSIAESS